MWSFGHTMSSLYILCFTACSRRFSQNSSARPTGLLKQAAKLFTNPSCSGHQRGERGRKTQWQRTLYQTVSYLLAPQVSHPYLSTGRHCQFKKGKEEREKSRFQPFYKQPVQAIPFNFVTGLSFTSQSPFLMVLRLALMFYWVCGCAVTCEKPPADSDISASPLSPLLEQGHLDSCPI